MATFEKIEHELNDAKVEYGKADKKLNDWEEGEDDGKWLKKLRRKLDDKEWEDEGQKERWEESVKKLEEKEKSLEEKERFWRGQVEEWGKALRGFGGGEGNEQIA